MSPMEDETSQSAAEHKKFITTTLSTYKKSLNNVAALIGDNCSTNHSLADKCNVPFIGCFSHILNLAVKNVMLASDEIKGVIDKVSELMRVLKTTKGAAVLRNITDVKAVKKNDTRWTSTYDMLTRYIRLVPSLQGIEEENIIQKMPTQIEIMAIKNMLVNLEQINAMMKYLQRENINLANARGCFDALIKTFPDMEVYLGPRAEIVHSKKFISAVAKVQKGETNDLSHAEKKCLESFRIENHGDLNGFLIVSSS